MMRRSLVVVGILMATAACATTAPASYDKAGVSMDQRKADDRACVEASIGGRESSRANFFVPVDREAYAACMVAKGYSRRSQ